MCRFANSQFPATRRVLVHGKAFTVRLSVVVLAAFEAPVADTVMVQVPAGVALGFGGVPPGPPPQLAPTRKPNKSRTPKSLHPRRDWRRGPAEIGTKPRTPAANKAAKKTPVAPAIGRDVARLAEVVETERLVEAVVWMPGVTEEGVKLQDAPVGRPAQVKPAMAVW